MTSKLSIYLRYRFRQKTIHKVRTLLLLALIVIISFEPIFSHLCTFCLNFIKLILLQIPVSFAYFKLDDGEVDEIIYQGYPHDDVMSHPSMTHHSQRGGGGNYGGGYKSAGSLMFGTTSPPPNDGFFDNNGGGNSQNGQYDSRVYNDGDMYAWKQTAFLF